MKITKKQLEKIIEAEVHEALNEGAGLGTKAVSGLKRLLNIPMVTKSLEGLKDVLDAQGDPGDPARKEEVVALLNILGINHQDLMKILGATRVEDAATAEAPAASPEEG